MKETKTVLVAVTYEIDLHKGCKNNEIRSAIKRGLDNLTERAANGEIGLQVFKLIHCEVIE